MRILLVALVLGLVPAYSDPAQLVVIPLGQGASLAYTFNPDLSAHVQPLAQTYTIALDNTPVVRTLGDPVIEIGGKVLGHWPTKHLTYKLKGGWELAGHADKGQGTTHTVEVYRPDGTMLRITGMDTGKIETCEYGKIMTWAFRKMQSKDTFVLDVTDR